MLDVLLGEAGKRSVDVRFLDSGKIEKIGGDKVKQPSRCVMASTRTGEEDRKLLKQSKLKVSGQRSRAIRCASAGAKRDDLQEAIALLRAQITTVPLTFENFRD